MGRCHHGTCRFAQRFVAASLAGGVSAIPHIELRSIQDPFRVDGSPLVTAFLRRSVIGNMAGGTDPEVLDNVSVKISHMHAQIAEIYLGTPPQRLTCLIDSGSSDLWLPSRLCTHCVNNNHFDARSSSTFKPFTKQTLYGPKPLTVEIAYGSGKVKGYAVHDSLQLGSLHVPRQAFIIVEDALLPSARSWDGICGLGWAKLAQVEPTVYQNMQRAGKKALFAIVPAEAGAAFPGARGGAHLLVGELPSAAYVQDTLAWAPAERYDPSGMDELYPSNPKRTFWIVTGGLRITRPESVQVRFLVDTGTNQVLLVPAKYYQPFIRSLIPSRTFDELCGHQPDAGVVCDCAIERATLKPLRITLGGREFVMPVSKMFTRAPAVDGGELCLLTVQPKAMPYRGPGIIVGGGGIAGLLGGILGQLLQPTDTMSRRRLQDGPDALLSGLLSGIYKPSSDDHSAGPEPFAGEPSGAQPPLPFFGGPFPSHPQTQPVENPRPRPKAPAQVHEEIWMLGGVFLEHFVTIFDFDNARLGFAEPLRNGRRLRSVGVDGFNLSASTPQGSFARLDPGLAESGKTSPVGGVAGSIGGAPEGGEKLTAVWV